MNPETSNNQPEKRKNSLELTESQILEQAKEEISPIQENLANQRITIDEAKKELQKINERLQSSNIDKEEKAEIWKAFEKLNQLERNVEEQNLSTEVSEIIKTLEKLITLELNNLKFDIQKSQNHIQNWKNSRPIDVQEWIQQSETAINNTIESAAQDSNPIARGIWKLMKWLNA